MVWLFLGVVGCFINVMVVEKFIGEWSILGSDSEPLKTF